MAFETQTQIRVRYADTDQMKTVYYAKFFEYFEQGRSDLLREMGIPYPEIGRLGYILPVSEAYAKYYKPARYDDLLAVKTIVREMPQVKIRIEYEVRNDETDELLAEGYTVHGFINAATRKPTRAPERFVQCMQRVFEQQPVSINEVK